MAFDFIRGVGIELEGAWYQPPGVDRYVYRETIHAIPGFETSGNIALPNDTVNLLSWKRHSDGSVDVCPSVPHFRGEVVSGILKEPEHVSYWIDKMYPNEVNHSCGLHVHVSFNRHSYYTAIANKAFFLHVLKELYKWGKKSGIKNSNYWSRLNGENHFCKTEYLADEQLRTTYKDSCRYSALNYCFGLHKTMELRVLPMFKQKNIAIQTVGYYLLLVEAYLAKQKKLDWPANRELTAAVEIPVDMNSAPSSEEEIVIPAQPIMPIEESRDIEVPF